MQSMFFTFSTFSLLLRTSAISSLALSLWPAKRKFKILFFSISPFKSLKF